MKKIIFLISFILLIPLNSYALEYPTLHYDSAVIYDLTDDEVLYELNSTEQKSIASLTKIMTIITAIENVDDINKTIIYDSYMKSNVAWYASVAGFKVGDKLTFIDLLYAAMLPSGADATVALAISTSGSIDNFVIKMNELAKSIGMTNSNFINVHGLDETNHYSTAEDIRKLLEYSLENETFKKIYTTKTYKLSTNKIIKSTVQKQADNFNLDLSKILGSKTGFTGNAKLCISALIKHQNHEIIIITLGAPTTKSGIPYNISDTTNLISHIENNYSVHTIISNQNIVKIIPVKNSKIEKYEVRPSKEIKLFLENDYKQEDISIKYEGLESLSYKNKKLDKIGVATYYYKNKQIGQENIYLKKDIKIDVLKIIKNNIAKIIVSTLLILLFVIMTILLIKKEKNIKK